MPVYRRRTQSIAKVNATSIDGYFGEDTPCFFIRGTILSDMQVNGEYRTLAVTRPGNLIEIEEFDGSWATVVITTRTGHRPGDNLQARVRLRDADLRAVGIECERILAGLGSFAQPLEQPPDESAAIADVAPVVPPPVPTPIPVPAAAVAAFAPWTDACDTALTGIRSGHRDGSSAAPAHASAVARAVNARGDERTSIIDGKVFIEIGVSVVAIALPVVLFFLRALFAKRDDR